MQGTESPLGEINVLTTTPSTALTTSLVPSHPNPFSDQTEIGFALAAASWVRLSIYDVAGRHVKTLEDGVFPAGERRLVGKGRNDHGTAVTSGVYFLRLETPQLERIAKLVLKRN